MYGLPPDFDAQIFVGRELERVTFTANTIHLAFDLDITVTLEGSFVLHPDSESPGEAQAVPVASSELMGLAGQRVRSAQAEADGTLRLEFEDGRVVACLDDSPDYESYRIQIADTEIVV